MIRTTETKQQHVLERFIVNTPDRLKKKRKTLTSNSHGFPDPYDFIVGDDKLTVEFYAYQDTVNSIAMHACMGAANRDMIQKVMADRYDEHMGVGPYVWTSGDVTLYLSPGEQLTWGKWSLAPAAMGEFIRNNELRGTQFILLWNGLGPVGYGQLVKTSQARSLQSITGPTNAFPDPYDRRIVSIGLTMEFYGYRGSISPTAMRDCISAASSDVMRHVLMSETAMSMQAPSYSYTAGGVNLFLSPTEHLTWHMWAFVPAWIQEFVSENDFKGTQFILLWERRQSRKQ